MAVGSHRIQLDEDTRAYVGGLTVKICQEVEGELSIVFLTIDELEQILEEAKK